MIFDVNMLSAKWEEILSVYIANIDEGVYKRAIF